MRCNARPGDRGRCSELPAVAQWCQYAEATRRIVAHKYSQLPPQERAVAAVEENVLVQLNHLSSHPCIAAQLATGELHTYGWYYDIASGQILQYDSGTGKFEALDGQALSAKPMQLLKERSLAC